MNGHYTVQLENDGNYEGEGTNTPGDDSRSGDFPEIFTAERVLPGRPAAELPAQPIPPVEHLQLDMGAGGDLALSGLWRVEGARAYSLAARNPGHHRDADGDSRGRGISGRAGHRSHLLRPRARHRTVPGLRLARHVGQLQHAGFRIAASLGQVRHLQRARQPEADRVEHHDQSRMATTPEDSLGLPTGYTRGSSFGKANGNTVTNLNTSGINAFPVAFNQGEAGAVRGGRTFRMSMGFRF